MSADPRFLNGLSRRDFFGGVGLTAGALGTLGAAAGGLALPGVASAMVTKQSNAIATGIAVAIDGQHAGYALEAAFDGVLADIEYPPDTQSPALMRGLSVPSRPRLRFDHRMSQTFLDWAGSFAVAQSLSLITFNSATMQEIYRFEMRGAVASEVRLATLDASASAVALSAEVTIQMTSAHHVFAAQDSPLPVTSGIKPPSHPALTNRFQMNVQGLESATPRIRTVEGVARYLGSSTTAKNDGRQQKAYTAPAAHPFKLTVALDGARPYLEWAESATNGALAGRAGRLDILDMRGDVRASVDFFGLLPRRASCPFPGATAGLPSAVVEIACRDVRLELAQMFS